jgi:hypothetical protein
MTVDDLQASIGQFAGKQRVRETDFAQERFQHGALLRRVDSPVQRVWQ